MFDTGVSDEATEELQPQLPQTNPSLTPAARARIESELRNQYLAGALGDVPMLETWPQLYVDDADEQAALRALARASQAPGGAPWICEQCGEALEPQFTSCWRCGAVSDKH